MTATLGKIEFRSADGKPASLQHYAGQVVLIVNVASKCGLTPQYDGLEKIYEKYRERGFTVLGFPANEFNGQEPGTNSEIQEFCRANFGVQFPVLEKIVVKGEGQHPLYKNLIEAQPVATKSSQGTLEKALVQHGLLSGKPDEIMWNFEKFLLDRSGKVVGRYAPDVTPEAPVLVQAIEAQLAIGTGNR